MLTREQNEELTRVGPGTPMGELLRRYWHPVAAVTELEEMPTRAIKLLGEELVLFKDLMGRYGLLERSCAHRRMSLAHGLPEEDGLRCRCGWKYDAKGRCIERPMGEPDPPEAPSLGAYPVGELGGLLFAYLGPEPAPLVPRWELLTLDHNVRREMFVTELPCNWLQCMENSMDPVHLEWLHGYFGAYESERLGGTDPLAPKLGNQGQHAKIGFDIFEHGIVKRRLYKGGSETEEKWAVGHPVLFPNILQQGLYGRYFLEYRVPMDDTHTWHVEYTCYILPPSVDMPPQERIPVTYMPLYDARGRLRVDHTLAQDHMVWVAQGAIMDRTAEHLGESDRGIILYRRLLQEQMAVVQDGGEPMNLVRDPRKNEHIDLPQEKWSWVRPDADLDEVARYETKMKEELAALLGRTAGAS